MGLMTSDQIDEMYDMAYKVGYEQGVKDFAERFKEKMGDVARIVSGDTCYYLVGKSLIDTTAEELTKGKNNT